MASRKDALLRCYKTINGPVKAGKVWVKYTRPQIDALLDVMKQLLVLEGFEFRPEEKESTKQV